MSSRRLGDVVKKDRCRARSRSASLTDSEENTFEPKSWCSRRVRTRGHLHLYLHPRHDVHPPNTSHMAEALRTVPKGTKSESELQQW